MEFFKQLFPLIDGLEKTTITIHKKGDKLTIGFLPETKNESVNDSVKMTSLTGTPEELDEAFFANIQQVAEVIQGVVTNAESVKEELKKEVKKKPEAKKAEVKSKATPKKKAPKEETGPNSEGDKHHQADLEEAKEKPAQESLQF